MSKSKRAYNNTICKPGDIFYRSTIIDDKPVILQYTIKEKLDIYPDSPYDYYSTEENIKQWPDNKNANFCTKYINDGIYDNKSQAVNNLYEWYKHYTTKRSLTETESDRKIKSKYMKAIDSNEWKNMIKLYPETLF